MAEVEQFYQNTPDDGPHKQEEGGAGVAGESLAT
jgi:hypothetical protein